MERNSNRVQKADLSLGQTLSTFHYTLLDLLSVVERGWPNALDFSLDLDLNIPRMYYLMNNSFVECFVHYLMNSKCTCVRSTTLDNFALDQTSLDKKQSSRLHSTRWPNALDISLNMHVERCIVKSRERLAWALHIGPGFEQAIQLLEKCWNLKYLSLEAPWE